MSQTKVYALVDCNNFFAACERIFNPALQYKPIVVLSNNDGCIIARSNEAKALGIPMGAPYFKYKTLLDKHHVHVFSSNFQLYGDMSQRVMQSLRMLIDTVEVYSIDEAFLDLSDYPASVIQAHCEYIRACILKWTGLPVSIGIGTSKTLAKAANHFAKQSTHTQVFDISDASVRDHMLKQLAVEDIWGVGSRWGQKFRLLGMNHAFDIQRHPIKAIRKHFSVVGERMALELNGIACFAMHETPSVKKNILASRSFGLRVSNMADIAEAIADHIARASIKLRKQNSRARGLHVFVRGRPQYKHQQPYRASLSRHFDIARDDTRFFIEQAKQLLAEIYQPGITYKKCGIMLLDLMPAEMAQHSLFESIDHTKSDHLMKTVDAVNQRFGRKSVFYAAQGIEQRWQMRSDRRSPRYTTAWDELAQAS